MTERMSNSEQHEGGFNMADAGRSLVNEAQGWGLPGEVSGRLSLEDWILNPSEVRNGTPLLGPALLICMWLRPAQFKGIASRNFPTVLPEGKTPPVCVQSLFSVSVNIHGRQWSYTEERFPLAQGCEDVSLGSAYFFWACSGGACTVRDASITSSRVQRENKWKELRSHCPLQGHTLQPGDLRTSH